MKRLIPIVLFAAVLLLTACSTSERPEGNLPAATAEPVMTEASATAEPAVTEAPESTEAVREEAHFYSPRFEAAIRNILGRGGEPIYLDELRGMKELELTNSGVVTLNDLAMFENLETLILKGEEIEDISAVASLKKLQKLEFADTRIRDYSPVAGLTELRSLSFGSMNFPPKDFSMLKDLTKLNTLQIWYCFSPDTDYRVLSSLTNLKTLVIRNCYFTDVDFLSGLKELKSLELVSEEDNIDISGIAGCTDLEYLMLWSTDDVTPLKGLKQLRSLELFFNGTDLTPLCELEMLQTLNIQYRPADADLSCLARIPKLSELEMTGCGITDIGFIAEMKRLTDLVIMANEIEDLTPLYGMDWLVTVDVSYNPITEEQVSELRNMLPGCLVTCEGVKDWD